MGVAPAARDELAPEAGGLPGHRPRGAGPAAPARRGTGREDKVGLMRRPVAVLPAPPRHGGRSRSSAGAGLQASRFAGGSGKSSAPPRRPAAGLVAPAETVVAAIHGGFGGSPASPSTRHRGGGREFEGGIAGGSGLGTVAPAGVMLACRGAAGPSRVDQWAGWRSNPRLRCFRPPLNRLSYRPIVAHPGRPGGLRRSSRGPGTFGPGGASEGMRCPLPARRLGADAAARSLSDSARSRP